MRTLVKAINRTNIEILIIKSELLINGLTSNIVNLFKKINAKIDDTFTDTELFAGKENRITYFEDNTYSSVKDHVLGRMWLQYGNKWKQSNTLDPVRYLEHIVYNMYKNNDLSKVRFILPSIMVAAEVEQISISDVEKAIKDDRLLDYNVMDSIISMSSFNYTGYDNKLEMLILIISTLMYEHNLYLLDNVESYYKDIREYGSINMLPKELYMY